MHSLQELADQFTKLIPQDTPPPAPLAAADATAPVPPGPVQMVDYAGRGFHLNVCVWPDRVVAAAELLDRNGFALDAVTGMDWIAENEMEVVYDYFHPADSCRVVVRTRVPRSKPEVPTISQVYPGANWHERETHEFFGIVFLGHPNLTPLLLPEDATYHPLRKDFVA
ncbi:MAG: NADH-quinone oxidoreductase subunit C [Verrucomicrobia bacterium]|nr:NADH-quinone oxidoreductase subunit C [Verrucomicrobiota bacterium]